ncbi:arabinan endo-1,5-alpha-L-arabinosidase [Natronobacillus azotifigens]|uniref:Family 43 glycosylhydrolase n=1 Tax=Natronobacillus azotifigens TaxID=472978 RepID=A0A9J6RAV8_9BACI|nr:family 43 glycosylhydrolase [Natronobacillus azotifigens]
MIDKNNIPKDNLFDETILRDENKWGTYGAHDPAIYKDGEWYYVFSTDTGGKDNFMAGVQIRRSKDLINWDWVGRAFERGVPDEAYAWTGAKGLWAPEVVKYADVYYMYYAASQFGKTQSFIGVATSSRIEGPYEDQGLVFKSKQGEEGPNAIDPNITFDRNGEPWMVYGSFFGGLYVNKINPSTGKFVEYGRGELIARRSTTVDRAIEGPYIVYNPDLDYYYLFVSYDSLFADYNIRVARSKNISGPFVDFNGLEMTDIESPQHDVGMKILGGYHFDGDDGWVAPGHNSVLKDGDDYYVCHHIRAAKDKHWNYLHIRKILWTDDGWPLVSPQRYAGETERSVKIVELMGQWEFIDIEKNNDKQDIPYKVIVTEPEDRPHFIQKPNENSYKLFIDDKVIDGKVIESWDWENWRKTIVFAGYDGKGRVTLGKKIE